MHTYVFFILYFSSVLNFFSWKFYTHMNCYPECLVWAPFYIKIWIIYFDLLLCSFLETYIVHVLLKCLHQFLGQCANALIKFCFFSSNIFYCVYNSLSVFGTLVWYHFNSMTTTSWQAPWMDRLVFTSILTLFGILIYLTFSCMECKNRFWIGLIILEYQYSSTWCMYIMISIKVRIYEMDTINLRV